MNGKLWYFLGYLVKGTLYLAVILGMIITVVFLGKEDREIDGLMIFVWVLVCYILLQAIEMTDLRDLLSKLRVNHGGMDRYQYRLVESTDELVRCARECLCIGESVFQIDPLKEYQDYKEIKVFNHRVLEANDYLVDAMSELESLLDSEVVVK